MVDKTIKIIENSNKKIKLLEIIGEGYAGRSVVYKCKYENDFAVCKIERKEDHDKDLASGFNRIIDFDKEFVRKNPVGFITLEDYGVIKNCDYKFNAPDDATEEVKNILNYHNKLKDCVYSIYKPVLDGTIVTILDVLTDKEYTDMVKQVSKAINTMNKNGYYHRDIWGSNIMFKKVNDNYQWYVIDYDIVYNYRYIYTENDRKYDNRWVHSNDILSFIYMCLLTNKLVEAMSKNKDQWPMIEEFTKTIKKSKDFLTIQKHIPSDTPIKFLNEVIEVITMVLFPELYKTAFTGVYYEKYKHIIMKQRNPDLILSLLPLVKDSTNIT